MAGDQRELTSPSNLSPVPSKQTIRVRFLWLGGKTSSVHWGSCKASGEVATGEEDRSLSSIQLASDSAMEEREKSKDGRKRQTVPFKASEHSSMTRNMIKVETCTRKDSASLPSVGSAGQGRSIHSRARAGVLRHHRPGGRTQRPTVMVRPEPALVGR